MIISYCLFLKFSPKKINDLNIKRIVFDFACCPSFLNSNIVECMFKDNLACIRKFIKSDNKIRVIRDVGDVICWECGMLRLWDIRDVEC